MKGGLGGGGGVVTVIIIAKSSFYDFFDGRVIFPYPVFRLLTSAYAHMKCPVCCTRRFAQQRSEVTLFADTVFGQSKAACGPQSHPPYFLWVIFCVKKSSIKIF